MTGLDVSSSMDFEDTRMAMAMQDRQIVAAIEAGRHKRIGFSVFLWAENTMPAFASRKVIGSRQEMQEASNDLVARLRKILRSAPQQLGSLTDVSAAMEYAAEC